MAVTLNTRANMIRHLFGTSIKALTLIGCLTCIFSANLFANSVTASWEANVEPDLKGYKLYYGSDKGNYTESIDVGNVTEKELASLTDGQLYFFAVTAYDSSGNESPKSTEVGTLIGENLVTSTPGSNGDSTGTDWQPVPGAESYQILKSTNPFSGFTAHQTLGAGQTSIQEQDGQKTPDTGVYYKVKATKNGETLYEFQTAGHFHVALKRKLNLVSLPLIPGDSTVTAVLGSQFNGATLSVQADKVHVYDSETGLYETAWLYKGGNETLNGKWLIPSGAQESPIKLRPNESFWIELTETSADSVFTFSGLVSTDTSQAIILKPGYNFVGTPFPVEVELDSSDLVKDRVVTGAEFSAGADFLVEWEGNTFERAWLFSKSGSAYDGKFMQESGAGVTDMKFRPGRGYVIWIKNQAENNLWTLPNPGSNLGSN
jgi:hypothetical protein